MNNLLIRRPGYMYVAFLASSLIMFGTACFAQTDTAGRSFLVKPLVTLPPSGTLPNISPWPSTGPVGIGTATPTSQLSVVGNIDIQLAKMVGYAVNDNFSYESQTMGHYAQGWYVDSTYTNGASLWISAWGNQKFFTNGQPRMTLSPSGYLGIGTVSPLFPLHVVANGNTNLASSFLWGQYFGTCIGMQSVSAANYALAVIGNLTSAGAAGAGGQKYLFYVRADGNVGIGTKKPHSTLAVEGAITAQQLSVTQTGWSDFVFDSAYRPLPLVDLDRYIQTNKHLPLNPSTTQVAENGLNVGEMEKIQM